jgi:hypothetical protein
VFDDLDEEDDGISTIHGMAMGAADLAPRQLQKAFDTVVRTRGGRPEAEAEGMLDGIWVEAAMHTFEVHGAWVTMETQHELPMSLARELAAKVGKSITVHTLVAREEVVDVKGSEDEWGYRNQYRSLEVAPDGVVSALEPPIDADYAAVNHGDFEETANAILWAMVTEQDAYSPLGEPRYVAYVLPPPRTSGLPPRMAELATLIHESGAWTVQNVAGQTMVRLQLPDGSRRFSRVTDEELAQLREATGIEPSK